MPYWYYSLTAKPLILVWGKALPHAGTDPRTFGVLFQESNITVLNPNQQRIVPSHYTGGLHYFIRKDSGPNAFGASVPVWVYGDRPANLKSAENRRDEVIRRYNDLEAQYQRMKQEYVSKALGSTGVRVTPPSSEGIRSSSAPK